MELAIDVKALLLHLLMLYVIVSVNGDYVHLTMLDGDLDATKGDHHTVVKRASLDKRSRPSAVVDTLNSLRRDKRVANMYYVSWDDKLESVATDLVRSCRLQTGPRVLGPNSKAYKYDGITGYMGKTSDVPDQLRSAYNKSQFRNQLRMPSMRAVGCAVRKDYCISVQQGQVVHVHVFVCIFAYNRSSDSQLKSGFSCSRCETDAVYCDDGLCRVGCKTGEHNCGGCASLCRDCQSATNSTDVCDCIFYYENATSRCVKTPMFIACGGFGGSHGMSISVLIVVLTIIVVSVALVIGILTRRCRRRVGRRQTSTVNEYDPGPNFVPTMSPPPYDADKPPAYTIAVNGDLGEMGAVGGVPTDDVKPPTDDSLPAYDNCVCTRDEEV